MPWSNASREAAAPSDKAPLDIGRVKRASRAGALGRTNATNSDGTGVQPYVIQGADYEPNLLEDRRIPFDGRWTNQSP